MKHWPHVRWSHPALTLLLVAATPFAVSAGGIRGSVTDSAGAPVPGALVTATVTERAEHHTVYSDGEGRFALLLPTVGTIQMRARSQGFTDAGTEPVKLSSQPIIRPFVLKPVSPADRAALAPASAWYRNVRFPTPKLQAEFAIQCGMCHQQGNLFTRIPRAEADWTRVLDQMAAMGGVVTKELRNQIPKVLNSTYTSLPPESVRSPAIPSGPLAGVEITEWDIGATTSMPHDAIVGSDGRIYSVDMLGDNLFRLDPVTGERRRWSIPPEGAPPGGLMGTIAQRGFGAFRAAPRLGPHSLQEDSAGRIWITLSFWKGLVRFDPKTESFTHVHQGPSGRYPHTLRFDRDGRLWYTLAVSNQVGLVLPGRDTAKLINLPTRDLLQKFFMRTIRFWMKIGQRFPMKVTPVNDPELMPIAYGLDVAPDGGIWFSQFNNRRIGRIDPATKRIDTFDTPFYGPRRLRVGADGIVWIPAYVDGALARFDPSTKKFKAFPLPSPGDFPYALNISTRSGNIWICGANSDTLIRFEPRTEAFTSYPLPTRVTFCRDIDFDEQGNVWTSNSNLPAWHVEGQQPRIIRLSVPGGA
ncbi:MAG: carboxypeptidase regulatory-like domain-containing protein [Nitrospirae bacterium]|nr:carboxypeptidase regulatory-like domain-containing protein [Nitrospirota bacterium]